jgi:hypothetical protein
LVFAPLTTDMSAWYAPNTVLVVLLLLALALYGFVVSLPRRTAAAPS